MNGTGPLSHMGSLFPSHSVSLVPPPVLSSASSPLLQAQLSISPPKLTGPPHPTTLVLQCWHQFFRGPFLYPKHLSRDSVQPKTSCCSNDLLHLVISVLQSNFSAPLQSSWRLGLSLLAEMPFILLVCELPGSQDCC